MFMTSIHYKKLKESIKLLEKGRNCWKLIVYLLMVERVCEEWMSRRVGSGWRSPLRRRWRDRLARASIAILSWGHDGTSVRDKSSCENQKTINKNKTWRQINHGPLFKFHLKPRRVPARVVFVVGGLLLLRHGSAWRTLKHWSAYEDWSEFHFMFPRRVVLNPG